MSKSVVITGCTSGFGYLTAKKFAANGFQVIATGRDLTKPTVKELNDFAKDGGYVVKWYELDVNSQDSVDRFIQSITKDGIKVDVLVNNAGYGLLGPIETLTMEEIESQFNTNVFGIIRMIKGIAPLMRKNCGGRIINIASLAGILTSPLLGIYSATKHAVVAMTTGFYYELAPFNIKVSMIEPGGFATNFSKNAKGYNDDRVGGTPYEDFLNRVNKYYDLNKATQKGENWLINKLKDPQIVADKIYKVASSNNPKLHNFVGYEAVLLSIVTRIMPYGSFERVVKWILS